MNYMVFITLKEAKNCPNGANKTIYYDDEIDYSDNLILCNRCKLRNECKYYNERLVKSIPIKEVEKRLKSLINNEFSKQDLVNNLYKAFDGYLTQGGISDVQHSFGKYTSGKRFIDLYIVDRYDRDYKIGITTNDEETFVVTYVERN